MKQHLQNTSRLEKKFFIVGKIYDTAFMTDQEIEDAVQKDLDNYVGAGRVNFGISTTDKMISLVFVRFINYDLKELDDKLIKDVDAAMVCGIGIGGFRLPVMWKEIPFYPYTFEQSVFKQCYKSAEYLGADKVEWMKMEVTNHSVVLRIK